MSLDDDVKKGKFFVRGAVVSQDGTALQNLHQATAYDLMPLEFQMDLTAKPSLMAGLIHSSTTVNTLAALTAKQQANGEVSLRVDNQGAGITMSAATAAAVGVASGSIVAANASRRYLCLVNTHATQRVSLAFGAAAVLDSGITLMPNGGTYTCRQGDALTTQEVRAIASGAATNVAIQEGV